MFKVDCENGLNFLADAKGLGGNSDIMNRDNGYKYKKEVREMKINPSNLFGINPYKKTIRKNRTGL